jgi:hypothetical protein
MFRSLMELRRELDPQRNAASRWGRVEQFSKLRRAEAVEARFQLPDQPLDVSRESGERLGRLGTNKAFDVLPRSMTSTACSGISTDPTAR